MKKIKTMISVGGDGRQAYTVRRLREAGYTVADDPASLPDGYDAVLLPLPVTSDGLHIKDTNIGVRQFCESLAPDTVLFAGKLPADLQNLLRQNGVRVFDYYARPEFNRKNAVPTAQGTLLFVMRSSSRIVSDLTVLVTGYGVCGKAVCRAFRSLGADVVSCSRGYAALADAQADGLRAVPLKAIASVLPDADVVINTVPAQILLEHEIDLLRGDALLADIASAPHGFDLQYAASAGKTVHLLPSLPGKCFPETAGNIIADTVKNIAEEEEL